MLYYRIEARCRAWDDADERAVLLCNRMASRMHSIYKGKLYLFPLFSIGERLTMAGACEPTLLRHIGLKALVGAFWEECGIAGDVQTIAEIGATALRTLLDGRRDTHWISWEYALGDNFIEFQETLTEAIAMEKQRPHRLQLTTIRRWDEQRALRELSALPGYGMWQREFRELGAPAACAIGDEFVHPCHYLCVLPRGDDGTVALDALLVSLYRNGRVLRNTYCRWVCEDADDLPRLRDVYPLLDGGTIVIEHPSRLLGSHSGWGETDIDDWDNEAARALGLLCHKFRNRVLTIFLMDGEEAALAQHLEREALALLPLRRLEPVPMDDGELYTAVRTSAQIHGIEPDDSSIAPLRQWLATHRSTDTGLVQAALDGYFDRVRIERQWPQYATDPQAWLTHLLPLPTETAGGNALGELQNLIGLEGVKRIVEQAGDLLLAQKRRREMGMPAQLPCMHMAFYGNPGTAKTTVARLIGQIFRGLGLLEKGELHEVGRADLVGKYVGWTAPTVRSKIRAAKGSVLFLDEAYALLDDERGLYGDEAIATLVQEMENARAHSVVILAGYPEELRSMIAANPGLQGRIAFHVEFPDYSTEELLQILALMAERQGLVLADDVPGKLRPALEQYRRQPNFANGRAMRNLLEQALLAQATRLRRAGAVTREEYALLLWDDFRQAAEGMAQKDGHRKIGFR